MSNRLAVLVAHDARLQKRYGIYYAYGFVVLFYLAVLWWGGAFVPPAAVAIVIYTDPAALGFFFLGALMMLEKGENTRPALAVTPVSATEYLFAKTTTLAGLTLISVTLIWAFLHTAANLPLLAGAAVLTAIQFIGIGVPVAMRFRTVTGYLIGSTVFLAPLAAPGALALIDPTPAWLYVIPAVSQLKLMMVAVGAAEVRPGALLFMLAVSALAAAGGIWLALVSLKRELGDK